MTRTARDRSYKYPQTVDARKDTILWSEAIRKERAFQWNAASPEQLAKERGGNDLHKIKEVRRKLEVMSGDYVWQVDAMPGPPLTAPGPNMTSSMAELAMGVPTEETAFLRQPAGAGVPKRVAYAAQEMTLHPWQHGVTDPCFLAPDELEQWKKRRQVLSFPPAPPPRVRVHAEVSGPHAAAVAAWRNSEVPLSQWELSARGDSLIQANQLATALAAERAKEQLAKLLHVTERASRGKARWQER